jgi:hypothetical protein
LGEYGRVKDKSRLILSIHLGRKGKKEKDGNLKKREKKLHARGVSNIERYANWMLNSARHAYGVANIKISLLREARNR